ncbi:MAG TPA: hypothetical protein VFL04_00495 [Rectinemataceae bacterium]|nr:hypothetical protein [Rectinemataceae bacterium]
MAHDLVDSIMELSDRVRYVALLRGGELVTRARGGRANASSSESDRYEELIVNPTLLTLLTQRGNIDCGGLRHVIIRYGSFFQLVLPIEGGHLSVCLEAEADPVRLEAEIETLLG